MTARVTLRRASRRPIRSGALASAVALATVAGLFEPAFAQSVQVGSAQGRPGATVTFSVNYAGQGSGANALAVDMDVDAPSGFVGPSDKPSCAVNQVIRKEGTDFAFRPRGCTPGNNCTQIRAGVISFSQTDNPTAIPDATVFQCSFKIPANAAIGSTFNVNVARASAVRPAGDQQSVASTQGGQIRVVDLPCAGDQNSSGNVDAGEATRAVLAFGTGNVSRNPAADTNGSGNVDAGEATRTVLNFGRGGCNP